MMPCARTPAPDWLKKHQEEMTSKYLKKRQGGKSFHWPQREGKKIYDIVRNALREMTDGHCSYCDACPVTATGKEKIDHFRPKSRLEFYHLAYAWDNLFYTCSACNGAKKEKWDERLLKPDDPDYDFERYFLYQSDSGKLEANPGAANDEKERAELTIAIFNLNRDGSCEMRKREERRLRGLKEDDLSDAAYRFLIPFVRS